MTDKQIESAVEFASSMRGRYILSQALFHAIKRLEAVTPEVMQEKSNIADMKYLRETLFNLPDVLFQDSEEFLVAPI